MLLGNLGISCLNPKQDKLGFVRIIKKIKRWLAQHNSSEHVGDPQQLGVDMN